VYTYTLLHQPGVESYNKLGCLSTGSLIVKGKCSMLNQCHVWFAPGHTQLYRLRELLEGLLLQMAWISEYKGCNR
jgi:hypothetical protein